MPLHTDDPNRPGNLTDEQYRATYAEGEPHTIPEDVLAAALARCDEHDARAEQ